MSYYLNNVGLINALGDSPQAVWNALLAADRRGLRGNNHMVTGHTIKLAEVTTSLPALPADTPQQFVSRNNQLLLAACSQIKNTVEQLTVQYGRARIAIVLGSSTSGILEGENAEKELLASGKFPENYDYRQQEIANPSEFLARHLNLLGPALTVSTACTSSAKAFTSARQLLALNLCDAVLVGGVDTLCRLTVNGFNALASFSMTGCNPFSRNRDGITIGEAAALFILSKEEGPVRLGGIGESSDAHHISAPDPEGRGAETAMRAALADSGMKPDDIGYINLHGTGTILNDKMESHAVSRIFGNKVICSSSKAQLGHTLGAAGATEAALCWMSLTDKTRRLPPHVWDGETDPELAPLNLARRGSKLCEAGSPRAALSNSFAFGGSNTCLVLQSA